MSHEPTSVPFLDLATQHEEIRVELDRAWQLVTATNGFIGGSHVEQFEADFSSYCEVGHCIGVGNGTDALELIFAGLGFGAGDEVIVPANTFIATVSAIVAVGATPVFVDVDPDTLLLTAHHVEAAITPATVGVAVVHLYGQMPDMEAIERVTDRAGLALIEDAAQAHGAEWAGRKAGSFGRAAAFSFYPGKNLGAFGDGGAVVTSDTELARTVRSLANHGRSSESRYVHDRAGGNSRLDGLQAAILSVKLNRLDDWNSRRREASALYRKLLDGTTCQLTRSDPRASSVHHLEVIRVSDRDTVLADLDSHGIGWGLHYPIPVHRQPPFAGLHPGPLPVTETSAMEIVSLPMYPTIHPNEVERVGEAIDAATDRTRR